MSEYIDEVSGLKFRKRAKPDITIQHTKAAPDSPTESHAYSIKSFSTLDTKKTNQVLDIARPNVPSTEYLQYVPNEWSTTEKMRQLLIWYAEKELEDQGVYSERNSIVEKVKMALINKLKTSNSVISLYDHPILEVTRERNVINVRNEILLKEYQEDMMILKKEAEQWNKCRDMIFEKHAMAIDTVNISEENGYKLNQTPDFMSHIEPDQREFLEKFLDMETNLELDQGISNMGADVAHFRQTLYIATQFNQQASKLADKTNSTLAHVIKENARIVPIEADKGPLGLFEDTESKRKQDEIRNLEQILLLLSQKNSLDDTRE